MKVLFAVNNDSISDAIIKKYQRDYKEVITHKNVYYFNAIIKELQNDKSYDKVVISEDLEPFANNNYDAIDKFLFEKLDKISDEATKPNGDNINIILICADRRNVSDDMLTKMFGIGIYDALIGEERNIDNLCKLLNHPRTKKEAKLAYRIDGSSIGYQVEDENNVSEAEVQNILTHYKRLGKDEDKYVDSFNNIVSQYTDAQMRIIIRYLPLNVKAVLEEKSPKYQELVTFSTANNKRVSKTPYTPRVAKDTKKEEKIKVKMLQNEKDNITKPIVIPSTLKKKTKSFNEDETENNSIKTKIKDVDNGLIEEESVKNEGINQEKRGRGRPKKEKTIEDVEDKLKRGRGRPKKEKEVLTQEEQDSQDIDLFNMDIDEKEQQEKTNIEEDIDLFNIDTTDEVTKEKDKEDDIDLFNLDEDNNEEIEDKKQEDDNSELFDIDETKEDNKEITNIEPPVVTSNSSKVLTKNKKIVIFVGTTKNGTSFIVNNLALTLSSMSISTAILDTTQNRNSFYIFTKNEQNLREIAEDSILNLSKGIENGINVNKYLTVYTQLPGKTLEDVNVDSVLSTLLEKHDIVLIDADFNTDAEYFEKSHEIYLVQSMDILTIQPLTAFLRDLKSKDALEQEKLKIIINKWEKVKSLTENLLVGGISSYNDPAMSYMTELFNKDKIYYYKVPFEVQNYVKYLETMVNCEISLKGYTKQLINALNDIAAIVYPLLNKQTYSPLGNRKEKMQFSESTKNTLNRMKNNY